MTKYIWPLLHIAAWLLVLSFFAYSYSFAVSGYSKIAALIFFNAGFYAFIFYSHSKFAIRELLRKDKYWYFVLTVALIIAFGTLIKPFYSDFINSAFNISFQARHKQGFGERLVSNLVVTVIVILISSAFQFAEDWFKNESEKKKLENQKLKAELAFLKSQVNPHFLFNVLNSLYALSIRKSEKAPEAILKLSGMMRYMLEENSTFVPLAIEVEFVSNYIELQKLRLEKSVPVEFETEGTIEGKEIAPLILIAMVENAFKHGVLDDPEAGIHVYLSASEKQVRFSVFNRINYAEKDSSSGIGLRNVERRLDLLYPDKHTLRFSETDDWYKAELLIELT